MWVWFSVQDCCSSITFDEDAENDSELFVGVSSGCGHRFVVGFGKQV